MRALPRYFTAAAIIAAFGLQACAQAQQQPYIKSVASERTLPSAYSATGTASWYGEDFHGRRDASGNIFDQNAMTAAHRTLPFNSLVRVTNLSNGRAVVVRVTDRGPYAHRRVIDLSRAAAQALGYISDGTARVNVQLIADSQTAAR